MSEHGVTFEWESSLVCPIEDRGTAKLACEMALGATYSSLLWLPAKAWPNRLAANLAMAALLGAAARQARAPLMKAMELLHGVVCETGALRFYAGDVLDHADASAIATYSDKVHEAWCASGLSRWRYRWPE